MDVVSDDTCLKFLGIDGVGVIRLDVVVGKFATI